MHSSSVSEPSLVNASGVAIAADQYSAYLKAYAGLLPNARTLTIPAAGHAPHLEQPEVLASAVLEFLGA